MPSLLEALETPLVPSIRMVAQDAGAGVPDGLSYPQLALLTFEAVMQSFIICVCGFLAAKTRILDKSAQKQLSTLNVQVLTPCLIFSKLASSLSLKALADIAVIPVFFVVMTVVCVGCARLTAWVLRLNKAESNFVTAMAAFGNSNSMPVSITVAIAYTLPILQWPDIPDDTSDDVASRGILYLLIFQQLGQMLRWSWGYNSLLAKPEDVQAEDQSYNYINANDEFVVAEDDENDESELVEEDDGLQRAEGIPDRRISTRSSSSAMSLVRNALSGSNTTESSRAPSVKNAPNPDDSESVFRKIGRVISRGVSSFLAFMNPPLWAMVISVIVAAVPALQQEFFHSDGFVQHTVSTSIKELGDCAIPLILVVLGGNLAPDHETPPASRHYRKIVFASLFSRMVLPSIVLLPFIALSVKYIRISIMDDPIFLLVTFILTVSPPAIQLSQICQLNQVFEKEMAGVLFWGYVVLTIPSAILIVLVSLKVLDWSGVTYN